MRRRAGRARARRRDAIARATRETARLDCAVWTRITRRLLPTASLVGWSMIRDSTGLEHRHAQSMPSIMPTATRRPRSLRAAVSNCPRAKRGKNLSFPWVFSFKIALETTCVPAPRKYARSPSPRHGAHTTRENWSSEPQVSFKPVLLSPAPGPRRPRRSLGASGAASRRPRRRFFSSLFFFLKCGNTKSPPLLR